MQARDAANRGAQLALGAGIGALVGALCVIGYHHPGRASDVAAGIGAAIGALIGFVAVVLTALEERRT